MAAVSARKSGRPPASKTAWRSAAGGEAGLAGGLEAAMQPGQERQRGRGQYLLLAIKTWPMIELPSILRASLRPCAITADIPAAPFVTVGTDCHHAVACRI